MSKISSLILGLASGAAMFGAIQYASGNDLRGTLRGTLAEAGTAAVGTISNTNLSSATLSDSMVNRTGKGDRATVSASRAEASQTLSFRVHGLSDTSVLLKLAANPAEPAKAQPLAASKAGTVSVTDKPQKRAVACEPPVSVLTEVARLMQPGRCVT